MRENELKALLGLPKRLGKTVLEKTEVQGVTVWVIPPPEPILRADGRRVKVSTHRMLCECPRCMRTLSVGRLAQHRC